MAIILQLLLILLSVKNSKKFMFVIKKTGKTEVFDIDTIKKNGNEFCSRNKLIK